ncbi:MAG: deaminase [Thermodesulfobacteriota bacterium]
MSEHQHFMRAALAEAEAALADGEFPVGCVLVSGGRIIGRGRRRNSAGTTLTELDHAEIVALRSLAAAGTEAAPGTITAYATMEPCLMCFATLLLNGVTTIVYAYEDAMGGGTGVALDRLPLLYREMQPRVSGGVLRAESLALFQRFFRVPANTYWQDSYLARYTLAQDIAPA